MCASPPSLGTSLARHPRVAPGRCASKPPSLRSSRVAARKLEDPTPPRSSRLSFWELSRFFSDAEHDPPFRDRRVCSFRPPRGGAGAHPASARPRTHPSTGTRRDRSATTRSTRHCCGATAGAARTRCAGGRDLQRPCRTTGGSESGSSGAPSAGENHGRAGLRRRAGGGESCCGFPRRRTGRSHCRACRRPHAIHWCCPRDLRFHPRRQRPLRRERSDHR